MKCLICEATLSSSDIVCPRCGAHVYNSSQKIPKPVSDATQQTGDKAQTGYRAPQPQPYANNGYRAPQPPGYYGAPQQPYANGYRAPQPPGYYGAPQQPYAGYRAPQPPGYYGAPGYAQPYGYSQKNRTAYMLLCFFLGGLGIQDFYAGRNMEGAIHLFVFIFAVVLGAIGGGIGILAVVVVGVVLNLANGFWALVQLFAVRNDGNGIPMR